MIEEQRATRLERMLAANGGDLMGRIQRLARHKEEQGSLGGAMVSVGLAGCFWQKQDVIYIIEDAEKAQFNKVKTDADCEKFIVEF